MDDGNIVFFWDGTPLILKREKGYQFLSILPLDRHIEGVSLQGVKYPLVNASLTRGSTLSISNEVVASQAHLSAKNGRMLVIRSRNFLFQ